MKAPASRTSTTEGAGITESEKGSPCRGRQSDSGSRWEPSVDGKLIKSPLDRWPGNHAARCSASLCRNLAAAGATRVSVDKNQPDCCRALSAVTHQEGSSSPAWCYCPKAHVQSKREETDAPTIGDTLQDNWSVRLKNVNVMRHKGTMRNHSRLKKITERHDHESQCMILGEGKNYNGGHHWISTVH